MTPEDLLRQGQELGAAGAYDESITAYCQALSLVPDHPAAHLGLGLTYRAAGQTALAVHHFRAALRADPNLVEAFRGLGEALSREGEWQQAGAAYYECLKRAPRDIEAVLGVAQAFCETAQPDMAVRTLRRALEITPDAVDLQLGLADLLLRLKRASEAIAPLEAVIGLAPTHAGARRALAAALLLAGQADRALDLYRRLAAEFPDDGSIQAELGSALLLQDRAAEAEAVLRPAARLRPFDHQILVSLVVALTKQSKHEEAAALQVRAEEIKPVPNATLRGKLSAVLYDPSLSPAELRTRTQTLVSVYEVAPPALVIPADRRDPGRSLRIGWLSSDFAYHVVAMNLWPIVRHLDRGRFSQYFYSDRRVEDPVTRRFRSSAAGWRTVESLSDAEVASIVRRDGIDILVVLAGRFDQNRPVIAARRAAPIQVSFHDPATSGLTSMDYLIADRYLTPPGSDTDFTERLLRLPSFYVRDPPDDEPRPNALPMLRASQVTFGSFSNPLKITARTAGLWAQLMMALPQSRLVLRYHGRYSAAAVRDRMLRSLSGHGIEAERLLLQTETADSGAHLANYHEIDMALDPIPFSGSTTTFEALWMGVPVVTRPGTTMVSRWTASMLHALHLDEFIARSDEDYIAIVRRWASRPDDLAALRQTLRQRVAMSPLCDGKLRARQIERLFRAIWRRHCAA